LNNFYSGDKKIPFEHVVKERGVAVPLDGAEVIVSVTVDGIHKEDKVATVTDSINGLVSFTMDFDQHGIYEFQDTITFPNGSVISSDVDKIKVKKKN
jgi:hypothetical protein